MPVGSVFSGAFITFLKAVRDNLKRVEAVVVGEAQDRVKLVYWLKSPQDLVNILRTYPGAPVFHFKRKEHIYIVHAVGDFFFVLETEEALPEKQEIPFSGERTMNLVEVEAIQAATLKQLAERLQGKPEQLSEK